MTNIQEIEDTNNSESNLPTSNEDHYNKKKNKFAVKEEITEENCRFDEGQILKFIRVRFPGHAKSYPFLIGKRNLIYGQKVMAMSDRGMAVGYINSFEYEIPFHKNLLPLRSINKSATTDDIDKERENYLKQKEIETICQGLIIKHKLTMNLTHVEFTQFGKKVVFYFVAGARVDFRGLVKDLVSELRLRIELRQISVRDRAASQGALGACGRELCCSSFLTKYGNVSIKMAKNQNLTLNYSKLNGVCGQLKCCLQYEEIVYTEKRKHLPDEGDLVEMINGDRGKVRKLYILNEQFEVLTSKGKIKRYVFDQLKKTYKDDEFKFPRQFDNISDETGNIVGLPEHQLKMNRQFDQDIDDLSEQARVYAHEQVELISDFLPERDRTKDLLITKPKISTPEKTIDFSIDITTSDQIQTESTPIPVASPVVDSPVKTSPVDNTKKPYKKRNNRNRNNRNKSNKNGQQAKPNTSKD